MRVVGLLLLTGCQLVFPLRDRDPVEDGGVVDVMAPDVPDASGPVRRVFLTSSSYAGDLGGITGADQECQQAAAQFDPDKATTFKAWLSTTVVSMASRLTLFSGSYVLPNGELVAPTHSDFLSGTLLRPIDLTEFSTPAPASVTNCGDGTGVWSNTSTTGQSVGLTSDAHCNSWLDQSSTGNAGNSASKDKSWTDDEACRARSCGEELRLYCVEIN